MAYEPIITNRAQEKMKELNISKSELMAAFYSNMKEINNQTGLPVGIARIHGYEICAMHTKDKQGQHKIVSCWKRKHA